MVTNKIVVWNMATTSPETIIVFGKVVVDFALRNEGPNSPTQHDLAKLARAAVDQLVGNIFQFEIFIFGMVFEVILDLGVTLPVPIGCPWLNKFG